MPATVESIWRHPLHHFYRSLDRLLCRSLVTASRGRVLEIRGLHRVMPEQDPFILAANHTTRMEALLLPTFLIFHRQGKLIHFLADWPMLLVPGVSSLYRRGGVIPVTGKSPRPAFLGPLRRLVTGPRSAFQVAQETLRCGESLGIFPEATMNRNPGKLLRGQTGAARLALRAGVPVVPVGTRFPESNGHGSIRDREPMVVVIGSPIEPPAAAGGTAAAVSELHARIMGEIGRLSGKSWRPYAPRRRHHG